MSIAFKLLSFSTSGILSLDDAKDHLRIPRADTDQDTLISALVDAAIQSAEDWTERKIGLSKYQFRIPAKVMEMSLPYAEFIEITKLSSITEAGSVTVLYEKGVNPEGDLTTYISSDSYVIPSVLKVLDAIPTDVEYYLIEATFGMDLISDSLLQGIKMTLAHYYDNASAVEVGRTANEVPLGAKAIFHINRFMRF